MRAVRRFYLDGKENVVEGIFNKPAPGPNEIEVKTLFAGICNSDVDLFTGKMTLPIHMHGHEGLGVVTRVGEDVETVDVGDYVATNADNCFADYYNAPVGTFIPVDKPFPRFILEPVGCAMNILEYADVTSRSLEKSVDRVMILGTGFLAKICAQCLADSNIETVVIGKANPEFFADLGINQFDSVKDAVFASNRSHDPFASNRSHEPFDVVIDLKGNPAYLGSLFDYNLLTDGAIMVMAAQQSEPFQSNFGYPLWKSMVWLFPSPRGHFKFEDAMKRAEEFAFEYPGMLDSTWSRRYDREDIKDVRRGFKDSLNGEKGRGYIVWNNPV